MKRRFNEIKRQSRLGWGLGIILSAPTLAFGQFAEVQQLSYWEYDSDIEAVVPLQLDSRVFRVEVGFDMFDPASERILDANGGAFINVFCRVEGEMEYEWAVENEFESLPDSSWFDLGNIAYEFGSESVPNGLPILMCELFISVTEEPLDDAIEIDPGLGQWTMIEPADKVFSNGRDSTIESLGDGFEARMPWEQMSTHIGGGRRPERVARIGRAPKNLPTVSEDTNECAPGATARSLSYLSSLHGFQLGVTTQELHEEYVEEMETDPKRGTKDSKALSGRRAIHGPAGRNYQVRSVDSVYLENDAASFGPGIKAAMDQVDHGQDVEINFTFLDDEGDEYGHRAMIAKIELFRMENGTSWYRVWTIDDNGQGDGKAANDLNCHIVNQHGTVLRQNRDRSAWIAYGRVDLFSSDQYVPRLSDLNNDRTVDGADLSFLLGAFGEQPDGSEDDGDFNGDGVVGGADLAITLGNWGVTFER